MSNKKKVVRLTESDLVRIVKRVVSEQTVKSPKNISQDQVNFEKYVTNKLFPSIEDRYGDMSVEFKDGKYILGGKSDSLNSVIDNDSVIWDFNRNQIIGTKSFGNDPKPIPFSTNYTDSVKWFNSWFK